MRRNSSSASRRRCSRMSAGIWPSQAGQFAIGGPGQPVRAVHLVKRGRHWRKTPQAGAARRLSPMLGAISAPAKGARSSPRSCSVGSGCPVIRRAWLFSGQPAAGKFAVVRSRDRFPERTIKFARQLRGSVTQRGVAFPRPCGSVLTTWRSACCSAARSRAHQHLTGRYHGSTISAAKADGVDRRGRSDRA